MTGLRSELLDHGPASREGLVDAICSAFNCTPDRALEQEPRLVFAILERRALLDAREKHATDITEWTEGQARLWGEMMADMEDSRG